MEIYRRFSLNLHRIKDKKIIDWIDQRKNEIGNISYSDIIRMSILDTIDAKNKVVAQPQGVKPKKQTKPKFKFKEE